MEKENNVSKNDGKGPFLSVVVPIYNTEKYLEVCLDSILKQTYEDFELILVDDGSKDESPKICDEYAQKDTRIKVIHKRNEGPIKARIDGVRIARGEYISFVDSDDWIEQKTYEKAIQSSSGEDVIAFGIQRYISENEIVSDRNRMEQECYNRKEIEEKVIPCMLWEKGRNTWKIEPSLCTKLIKKSLLQRYLEKVENLGIHYGEDVAVIYPLMLEMNSLCVIPDCFYYHRQREVGINYPYVEDEFFFDKLYRLYDYLKREFKKSKHFEVLQRQLEHFYLNALDLKKTCMCDIKETEKEVFPYWEVQTTSKVVLYGAGYLGQIYKAENEKFHFCNIVLWVDKAYETMIGNGGSCPQSVKCIEQAEYDYILLAVKSPVLAKEIKEQLIESGVEGKKIIWNAVRVVENVD